MIVEFIVRHDLWAQAIGQVIAAGVVWFLAGWFLRSLPQTSKQPNAKISVEVIDVAVVKVEDVSVMARHKLLGSGSS